MRRWVASQAESRSGTGAACGGCRSERAATLPRDGDPLPPSHPGCGAARGRAALAVSGGSGRWAAAGRGGGALAGGPGRARGEVSRGERAGLGAVPAGRALRVERAALMGAGGGGVAVGPRADPGREGGRGGTVPFPARIPPPALVPWGLAANPAPCGKAGPQERATEDPSDGGTRGLLVLGAGRSHRAGSGQLRDGSVLPAEKPRSARTADAGNVFPRSRLCVYLWNRAAFSAVEVSVTPVLQW